MSDRAFVDTNILIYAIEPPGRKPDLARTLLKSDGICLSTQVLGEFYHATTRRNRPSPLLHEEAVAWVQIWKRFEVSLVTVEHVDLAIELKHRYQLAYYDALIVAAASFADCNILISEDLNSGQQILGVTVTNPFQSTEGRAPKG